MWVRETLRYAGGLVLAVALLVWVLRGIDPKILWAQMREASALGLMAAAVLGVGQNVFRVWRWRALLEPVRPGLPFRPMFDAVILGYATSWAIPGRLGEIVRPALLAGRERLPLGPCLGSVLADRLLDGMAVLVLFGVGVALLPLWGGGMEHALIVRGSAFGIVALMLLPIVALLVASRRREPLERWIAGTHGWRAWVGRSVLALSEGVEALKRPKLLVRSVVHTLGAWLMIGLSTWVGVRACGVEIPFVAILVLMPLLVLGIALPTPGGAGGYHAAMRVGLMELFGVSEPQAVGAGLLQHAVIVLPILLLGGILLVVDRVPIAELVQAARQIRDMGAVPRPPEATGRPTERLS
jgi:uncharacterized protein (TIRG00374 family)